MNTGHLQRRFSTNRPEVFDKETRIVCLDIQEAVENDENGQEQQGFSFIPVEIDHQMDYGHIKSQLIEAGFAQKDEFGLLMNSVEKIINAVKNSSSWATFKSALNTEDIETFVSFCEFRRECANAAHVVISNYQ